MAFCSGTLGNHPVSKGIAEKYLTARRLSPVWLQTSMAHSISSFLVEFLIVSECAYVLPAMVCHALMDLVVVVWLS